MPNLPPANTGTIALETPPPVALGDTVTFECSWEEGKLKNPLVNVHAYQDGTLVYGAAGKADEGFQLGGNPDGGSAWANNGGPASCTATLFYYKTGNHEWNGNGQQEYVPLATVEFPAGG